MAFLHEQSFYGSLGKTHVENGLKLGNHFALHRVSGFLATNDPQRLNLESFLAVFTNRLAKRKVGTLRSSASSVLLETTLGSILDTLLRGAMRANRKSNVGLFRDHTRHLIDDVVSVGSLLTASCLVHSYNIPYSDPSLNHIGPKYRHIPKYAKPLGFLSCVV